MIFIAPIIVMNAAITAANAANIAARAAVMRAPYRHPPMTKQATNVEGEAISPEYRQVSLQAASLQPAAAAPEPTRPRLLPAITYDPSKWTGRK